jgi:hypothetical protein
VGSQLPGGLLAIVSTFTVNPVQLFLRSPYSRPHPNLLLFGSPCSSSLPLPDNSPIHLHLSPPLGPPTLKCNALHLLETVGNTQHQCHSSDNLNHQQKQCGNHNLLQLYGHLECIKFRAEFIRGLHPDCT